MLIQRFSDAASFLAEAEPFLLEAEIENNLILGVARELASREPPPAVPPYFAAVRDGGAFLAIAFSSIPHKLGLTRSVSTEALVPLARDVHAACPGLRMVGGPEPTAATFAEILAALRGAVARPHLRHRIHALRRVEELPHPAPGRLRPAREDELDLITGWIAGFLADISDRGDPAAMARERIGGGTLFVWEDGRAVSMAGWAGKTANGVRVNFVYTPPELRGRGYATACVAELSRLLLDCGNRFCCLYTDLANPTSNAIYERIGYRPVADGAMYLV